MYSFARLTPMSGAVPGEPQPLSATDSPMAKRTKSLVGLDIDPSGITAAEVRVNGRLSIERAAVLREARGWERPSDHVPVIAELALV